jgi:hypothetical protein
MVKNRFFSFRVSPEDLGYIEELSKLLFRTKGDAIRFAIYSVVLEKRFPLKRKKEEPNGAKL